MTDQQGPPPGGEPYDGPSVPSQEERTWALASHIGALVTAWLAFGFLAPLFVLLLKNDSPFVRRHAVESLNFQLSLLIYSVVGGVLGFVIVVVTLGLGALVVVPVVIVFAVVALCLVIMATVKASNGEDYRYPFCLRFIS